MSTIQVQALSEPRKVPDASLEECWTKIVLPDGMKTRLLGHALLALTLKRRFASTPRLAVHGLLVLTGPPGTGKTTVARGLANELARQLRGKLGPAQLVELNPHALTSEMMGRTQRAVVQILEEHIPALAEGGPLVLLLDEVEALAASRSLTSLQANPVDIHRATDAVLSGLDRLARSTPNLLTVATTNFVAGVDDAFISRADLVMEVPLPTVEAIERILQDTLEALALEYKAVATVAKSSGLKKVAALLEGKDGRQVRKFVVDVLARDVELALDPDRLRLEHLLDAVSSKGKK